MANCQDDRMSTAPANSSADYLHITNAAISPAGEISLTWASVAGKKYQARISTDLGVTNQWATLGGPVTATGASSSIPPGNIIPAGLYPRYYLRIELVP